MEPRKTIHRPDRKDFDRFCQPMWPSDRVYEIMKVLEATQESDSWLAIAARIATRLGLPTSA